MNAWKRYGAWLTIGLAACSSAWSAPKFSLGEREALEHAAAEAAAAIRAAAPSANAAVAVLPVAGDREQWFVGAFGKAIAKTGLRVIDASAQEPMGLMLRDTAWEERNNVRPDPAVLKACAPLRGVDLIVAAAVRDVSARTKRYVADIEWYLADPAAGRILAADETVARIYPVSAYAKLREEGDDNDQELRALTPVAEDLLREAADDVAQAIQSLPRLANTERVAVLPIAGDIDGTIGRMLEESLARTRLFAVKLDARTPAEAVAELQGQTNIQVIMHGSLRDLSMRHLWSEPLMEAYQTQIDVPLRLYSAEDGAIVWAYTIDKTQRHDDRKSFVEIVQDHLGWIFIGAIMLIVLTFIGLRKPPHAVGPRPPSMPS